MSETGLLLTIEDHWIEGGLGDAVLAALAERGDLAGSVVKVAVTEMPGSGTPEELRDWAGISAGRIAERVRSLLG
jgi:transketolase